MSKANDIRIFGIPHTYGKYLPRNGYYLCNGHCNWDTCFNPKIQCDDCGYIQCYMCHDEYEELLDSKGLQMRCRNCLSRNYGGYFMSPNSLSKILGDSFQFKATLSNMPARRNV